MTNRINVSLGIVLLALLALSGCGGGSSDGSPSRSEINSDTPHHKRDTPNVSSGYAGKASAAYVVDYFTGYLTRINLQTGAVDRIAAGLGKPVAIAISNDGKKAYVIEFGGKALTVVDLSDSSMRPLTTGLYFPVDIEVASDGSIYILGNRYASAQSSIISVDPSTGATTVVTTNAVAASGFTLAPNERYALVVAHEEGPHPLDQNYSLFRVELGSGETEVISSKFLAVEENDGSPDVVLVKNPEFVALVQGEHEVNLNDGSVSRLDLYNVAPAQMAVDPNGKTIVSVYSNGFNVVNVKTGERTYPFELPENTFINPVGIALYP